MNIDTSSAVSSETVTQMEGPLKEGFYFEKVSGSALSDRKCERNQLPAGDFCLLDVRRGACTRKLDPVLAS